MNRTLACVLAAAAAVGASGGTVVAARVVDGGTDRPLPAATGATGAPVGRADARADQVLWATRDELHDGEVEVALDLPATPVALQRAADGWVVSTTARSATDATDVTDDEVDRRTWVVSGDGRVRDLADTAGPGDVSPDGTRYVAQARDGSGYAVWDLASGERLEAVAAGRDPAQEPGGGAQFVDADTVATAWLTSDGVAEVVRSDLGSPGRTVVAEGVVGDWAVSPDGRWFAGSLPLVLDGKVYPGCVVVRPVDGGVAGRTDCGGRFAGFPTFARDSTAVLTKAFLTTLGDPTFEDPDFRPVPTGDRAVPPRVRAPRGALFGVLLDQDRVVSLGSRDADQTEGTSVQVCRTAGACTVVGRADTFFQDAVLGTAY